MTAERWIVVFALGCIAFLVLAGVELFDDTRRK